MTSPTAGIVIIGNEILSAKLPDANGPYLLRALRARGLVVEEMRLIADSIPTIATAVTELATHNTHVFTTGGIGPTHDDLTVAGVARAFDVPVIRDPQLEDALRQFYGAQLTAAHLKMAEVPQGAEVIPSRQGYVPTVRMHNVVILPGVPALMRRCFEQATEHLKGPEVFSRAILLWSNESDVAELLAQVQNAHPEVAIGSYPRFDTPDYRVKVTVDGCDAGGVDAACHDLLQQLPTAAVAGEEPPRSSSTVG